MDLFNETGYLPSASINSNIDPIQHSIQIPNLLAQCPACEASQNEDLRPTAYTSAWSSEGVCASFYGWHSSSFFSYTAVDSQDVTFQDEEFTFLNDVSEAANPDHTIAEYTWVDESSTTTCERCTATVDMGHADVTVGSCSETFEQSSWSTPSLSATAGTNDDDDDDDDLKTNDRDVNDIQKEDAEGDDSEENDSDIDESVMLIRPLRLERSMTAFWVLLLVGVYFDP